MKCKSLIGMKARAGNYGYFDISSYDQIKRTLCFDAGNYSAQAYRRYTFWYRTLFQYEAINRYRELPPHRGMTS